MKPIRKDETQHHECKVNDMFRKKREQLDLAYSVHLNQAVDQKLPELMEGLGVADLMSEVEDLYKKHKELVHGHELAVRNSEEHLREVTQQLENKINSYDFGVDKRDSIDLGDKRHSEIFNPQTFKVETYVRNIAEMLQRKFDTDTGNALATNLDNLEVLRDMAVDCLYRGDSLTDSLNNIQEVYLRAGIKSVQNPKDVPPMLEYNTNDSA